MIITTGQPFTDIDSLACALAYTQLKQLEGNDAECVLPGPLNKSVTNKIKGWELNFSKVPITTNSKYVLVDISEPEYFARFVNEKDVIEVYDHRNGFEDYWTKRIGQNSHIEMMGSCATLIWEEFVKRECSNKISKVNANLLYTAIISNTLNFQASVTTDRDKKAFVSLERKNDLPEDWTKTYFLDQEKEVESDIKNAILNDTKVGDFVIGQLELWDSKKIILKHLGKIEEALKSFGKKDWFLTSPSISEGVNYIFTKSQKVKVKLEEIIGAKFNDDIGTTKKLWLRKEILSKL